MTRAATTNDHLYKPSSRQPELVDIPAMQFVMVDGVGDPNTAPAYKEAVEALYALSYALKFALKREGQDYKVGPLEGHWWVPDVEGANLGRLLADKSGWHWTMMVAQPETVTQPRVDEAVEELGRKKNLAALNRLRFETFHEGFSAQIMHLGPYAAELPTIERLHGFIHAQGYRLVGKHHEIYLSDPRRSAPERLRTILRQPVGTRKERA